MQLICSCFPQEWGASCPHAFVGAFRLEYDMSWTPIEEVEKRSEEIALMDKIYNAQQAITDSQFTLQGKMKPSTSSPQIKDVSESAAASSPWCDLLVGLCGWRTDYSGKLPVMWPAGRFVWMANSLQLQSWLWSVLFVEGVSGIVRTYNVYCSHPEKYCRVTLLGVCILGGFPAQTVLMWTLEVSSHFLAIIIR